MKQGQLGLLIVPLACAVAAVAFYCCLLPWPEQPRRMTREEVRLELRLMAGGFDASFQGQDIMNLYFLERHVGAGSPEEKVIRAIRGDLESARWRRQSGIGGVAEVIENAKRLAENGL